MTHLGAVIFRTRLHNGLRVFGVVQASVNSGFSVLLCTKRPFARTPLHNARSSGGVPGSLDCPVERGPGDAEEFSDLRGRVVASLVDLDQVLLLRRRQFGLLAPEPTIRLGNLHPLASTCADQVGLEFNDHREHIEEEPADRIGGVMNGTTDTELHFTLGEIVNDVFRVAKRPCQPVELGHDEGIAGSAGG